MAPGPVRDAYDMWPQYNRRLRDVVAAMSDEQLAIRPSAERWPIWATVAHTAGARAYWICAVMGEPGLGTTPFDQIGSGVGWGTTRSTHAAPQSWQPPLIRRSA